MTENGTLSAVQEILRAQLDIQVASPDHDLIENGTIDSLAVVELIFQHLGLSKIGFFAHVEIRAESDPQREIGPEECRGSGDRHISVPPTATHAA